MAAAGVVVALVVVRAGGLDHGLPMIGGEGSGTVTLEPELVEPREPGSDPVPSTPERTVVPSEIAEGPDGGGPTDAAVPNDVPTDDASPGRTGVSVGSVGGLFPGHRVELGVTYVNPYSFPIAIDTVNVTATGTDRCSARYLSTPQPTSRLRLPSGSSVDSTLEVGMRRSAPDACQGVRFAVRVQVTAVQL
jgi:hypothetical protein